MTFSENGTGWRAKLYELEGSGTWVDQGTGLVTCQLKSSLGFPALLMTSELSDGMLLQSEIQSDELYEKQGDSLILWKQPVYSGRVDYALSFQDPEGCSSIWTAIRAVQAQYLQQREYGNIPSFVRTQRSHIHDGHDSQSVESIYSVLPPDVHEPGMLQLIKQKLDGLHVSHRDYVAAQLMDRHCAYLHSLFDLFNQLELEQKTDQLRLLADIMRAIVLLNDPSIIEYLLSDRAFESIAGIFEYDHTLKEKASYRQFFQRSSLRSVVELSAELCTASTFLFRLKFVRDIMLHPTIDEPGITAMNSMITFTSGEICYQVLTSKSCMQRLFEILDEPQRNSGAVPPGIEADSCSPPVKPIDGLRFFRELITLSKFIVLEKRVEFYRIFLSNFRASFFGVITTIFAGAAQSLRARTVVSQSDAAAVHAAFLTMPDHTGSKMPPHVVATACTSTPLAGARMLLTHESPCFFHGDEVTEALALAAEILAAFVCTCPSWLRQEVLDTPAPLWGPGLAVTEGSGSADRDCHWMHSNLLFLLIDLILNAHDASTIDILGDCLKALLDIPATAKVEKDRTLHLFYEHYAAWVLVPFLDQNDPSQPIAHEYYFSRGMLSLLACRAYPSLQPTAAIATSRRVVFEVLGMCVSTHSYRAKYFLIRSNLLVKIVSKAFARAGQRHLQLLAVKFVKHVLRVKDEFYLRHLDKLDALRPLFMAFKVIASKDNLLTSSVHDLLEFVRAENMTTLIVHIVERYAHCFENVQHVEVFDGIRVRYDQLRDRDAAMQPNAHSAVAGEASQASVLDRHRSLDEEESYFFGESVDEDEDDDNHKEKKMRGDSPGPASSDSSLAPGFLDSLRHKSIPAKPVSPPHYSHRLHGTPLDGDAPVSDSSISISAHIGPSQSPSGGEVLALLVNYADEEDERDDGFPGAHLPPLKPKFPLNGDDDEVDFPKQKPKASVDPGAETADAADEDGAPVGGLSFSLLKKKRTRLI